MKAWMIAAMMLTASAPPVANAAHKPSNAVVVKFVGGVDHRNAMAFLKSLHDQAGKIVGLNIHVEPGDAKRFPGDDYVAREEEDQFVVSKAPSAFGEAMEMVAPDEDVGWRQGEYVLGGFYRVKSGGIRQGVTAMELEKVSGSDALPGPKSKVVERPIE